MSVYLHDLRNKAKLLDSLDLILQSFKVPTSFLGFDVRTELRSRIKNLTLAETEKLIDDLKAILTA